DLAQIGLDPRSAQRLIDGIAPGGIDVQTYRDARTVLDIRRDLRGRLARAAGEIAREIDEAALLYRAAERVAAGEGIFTVRADLTVDLTSAGIAEHIPPAR